MSYNDLYQQAEKEGNLSKLGLVKKFFTTTGEMVCGKIIKVIHERDNKTKEDRPTIVMHTDEGYQQVYISDYYYKRIQNDMKPGNIVGFKYLGKKKLGKGRQMHQFESYLLAKGELTPEEITEYGM